MELLRRLLGEGDSDCGCGHSTAVHWRREDGKRTWCSAPGCTCSLEVAVEEVKQIWLEEGDGFRIIPSGARGRKTA